MAADPINTSEFLDLIRGQARLEAKMDAFVQGQSSMRLEIDTIKTDLAAIKTNSVSNKSYLSGIAAVFTVFWIGLNFLWPMIKEKTGI